MEMHQETILHEQGSSESSPAAPDECAGCGIRIQDRYYLLTVDRQWHASCLRCCECRLPLDSEITCYSKDGNIYCKEDYYRLFCVKCCARCGNGISSNELVMRARDSVYHLNCFSCIACGILLSKGDVFGMRDGVVYCRPHYETVCLDDYGEDDMNVYRCQDLNSEGDSPSQYYNNNGTVQKGRPRKRKLNQDSPDDMQLQSMRLAGNALDILQRGDLSSSMESLAYDSSVTSPSSVTSHTQRTKRMRTSFKHHQLRTMKSYFAINQNPDAKDLKQLAQKTGLSKRVLQVWFQNARAKWRRNVMRQDTNPHAPMTPNGNHNHTNGSLPPVPNVGVNSLMLGDNMQPSLDDMTVHTPHPPHQLPYTEMY